MRVRSIPPSQWPEFLDRFGREHRAWLATLVSGDRTLAENEPLEQAGADDGITLKLGTNIFRIDRVRTLVVEETPEGATEALHVEHQDGQHATLRFRVASPPGELDGLAPGEY